MLAFLELVKDIQDEVKNAEGGWYISENGNLVVYQRVSRRPELNANGGDYDYFRIYTPGKTTVARDIWSCDFADRSDYGGGESRYECIISTNGLRRIAEHVSD